MNLVVLSGNLTRDVETRYLANGTDLIRLQAKELERNSVRLI